jgi:hypothetical protein
MVPRDPGRAPDRGSETRDGDNPERFRRGDRDNHAPQVGEAGADVKTGVDGAHQHARPQRLSPIQRSRLATTFASDASMAAPSVSDTEESAAAFTSRPASRTFALMAMPRSLSR